MRNIFVIFIIAFGSTLLAQTNLSKEQINPNISEKTWNAVWITHPIASATEYGVYYFKQDFELSEKPDRFIIHISADNRYELYVNKKRVALGPAWGDLLHWQFESIDISPWLTSGKNRILARVVNFGQHKGVSQISYKTAFIIQGDTEKEEILNTSTDNWHVRRDYAYRPIQIDWRIFPYYYAGFPCDTFIVANHPENLFTSNSGWLKPICEGYCKRGSVRKGGHYFSDQSPRLLTPRRIPLQEESKKYFLSVERTVNIDCSDEFLNCKKSLTIPANTKSTLLIDNEKHTRGYPELYFSKGNESSIKLEYVEALVDSLGNKGNRNNTSNKETLGYFDVIVPDGGINRTYRPTWHRVFRYVEMEIETADEPLIIDSLYYIFTGYPYELKASFETDNPIHQKLFETGWRTLRNGTAEVFEDGPYYEQLMYAGDMRIESIVSLYMSGDDRMTRNVIELFDNSRIPDGLTYSRYPSNIIQINPQYSLAWIQAIYDYFMYKKDDAFFKKYLKGIDDVLTWHEKYIDETGMLGVIPWLRHIEAKSGSPVHPERGHSAQQTLFFALSLQKASEINQYLGYSAQAERYKKLHESLIEATYRLCWDEKKNLLGDTPQKEVFTQHANTLGILTDAIPIDRQKDVMNSILNDTSLIQSYLFFRMWVFEALDKAGMGNKFLDQIGHWEKLLDYGFTTFPEFNIESRSDCHPWSTHINYFFLSTVAGVKSKKPGFEEFVISPSPGHQKVIKAEIPHPKGIIRIHLHTKARQAEIWLPDEINSTFIWKDIETKLKTGYNKITL